VLLFYCRCNIQVLELCRTDGWNIICQYIEQGEIWVCISVPCYVMSYHMYC